MNIQLLHGRFNDKDAIELITQMIHLKIRFHENKISSSCAEEDIKMRERRIKELQRDLYDARKYIEHYKGTLSLNSEISIQNEKNAYIQIG